ncbi:SH3 domain-containing protein [bacterium]|nr:SH3 domain-containing protein [bacterium]
MSSVSVPKPSNAGQGQRVVATTKSSFANVRSGPGLNYADIGDILNKSTLTYYPASLRDGWVWVEQGQTRGWTLTSVISFEPLGRSGSRQFPAYPL